ncbi:MAG TPA: HD domain-containing protein [Candidatus Altiarchaeales archaeon]|nr:HD domain-containing protein [Candidatus Altiarchaeales archaeon]
MKPYKVIRDPIHGNIGLSELEVELIDTRQMQRLRNVKQNGLCYLVYPAMNSTRFEHSLGVMHLGGVLAENLELGEEDAKTVRCAGLLHDIGHGPFSHTTEFAWKKTGADHEYYSEKIVRSDEISKILREHGVKPKRVCQLIKGVGALGGVISSPIDVDKMDYLIRDAYYAGVAYGITDVERVLQSIRIFGDEISVDEDGLEAVESLLVNRNLMYQTVYRHHAKRIAEAMFRKALQKMVEEGFNPESLVEFDDVEMLSIMRGHGGFVSDMIRRLEARRLYKNVFRENLVGLDKDFKKEVSRNPDELEERIEVELGLDEGSVIVDYPEVQMSEFKVKILSNGKLKPIDDMSTIAKNLEQSDMEKLCLNIYCETGMLEKTGGFNPKRYVKYSQTHIDTFI